MISIYKSCPYSISIYARVKEKEESNIKYDVKKNHVKTSADGLMNSSRR